MPGGRPRGRRMTLLHQDDVRSKIQASLIVKRLVDHMHGTVELSVTQLKAAEILLRKSLPDLSSVEMSGGLDIRQVEQELQALNHAVTSDSRITEPESSQTLAH